MLRALLWGFHNQQTGRCFPSYERIAEAAHVHRSTVNEAIAALEDAHVLCVENRLLRQYIVVQGLLGPERMPVVRRTSNAYSFRDPQPPRRALLAKSPNSAGTRNQDSLPLGEPGSVDDFDPTNPLHASLMRLQAAIKAREAETGEEKRGQTGSD